MAKINDNEYECAVCGGVFTIVRDETWSDEKAKSEFDNLFPDSKFDKEKMDVVCDDCWQLVKPIVPFRIN